MKILIIGYVLFLSSCLSNIDKNLMMVTDKISSVDAVTGRREINLEPESKEIARANQQTQIILNQSKKRI